MNQLERQYLECMEAADCYQTFDRSNWVARLIAEVYWLRASKIARIIESLA